MTELIKINETEGKKTVSARELHQKLEATERFNSWMDRMLKYGFELNTDYTTVKVLTEVQNNGGIQKRELDEYYISIDMAKEICMIQRSEIGKKFRQYFIECEKALNNVVAISTKTDRELNIEEAHILENLIPMCPVETYKQVLAAHISYKVTGEFLLPLPKAEKKIYTATQIAEMFGVTKNKVGMIANKNNLKTTEYGEVIWDRAKNGKQVENFVYYENGVEKIKELLNA